MNIAIRVDSSLQMGTGHVMRCLSLAEALQRCGAQVHFICRELPGHMGESISAAGHRLTLLPATFDETCAVQERPQVDARLEASWQKDARETMEAVGDDNPDWLIIDHYGIDDRWHRYLRPLVSAIMVVDDLANRTLDCDLLLDQNFYNDPLSRYAGLVPDSCEMLLGPKYMMLRDEFIETSPKTCASIGQVGRLLVFLGGADADNDTFRVVSARS